MGTNISVLVLCLVVFALLVIAFSFLLIRLYKSSLLLIKYGAKDEEIKKDYLLQQEKKNKTSNKVFDIFNLIAIILTWIIILAIVSFTIYVSVTSNNTVGDIPVIKTVQSGSMSEKLDSNTYLEENNLNDQFTTSDLIILHKTPDVRDINQYDIVMYELNDKLIVHRVVSIQYDYDDPTLPVSFITQGDNVLNNDAKPVSYEQIKGVYYGERIQFLGSFIRFMQSPAGYVCIIFVALVSIALPIIDNKLEKTKKERLKELLEKDQIANDTPLEGEEK